MVETFNRNSFYFLKQLLRFITGVRSDDFKVCDKRVKVRLHCKYYTQRQPFSTRLIVSTSSLKPYIHAST